MSSETAAILLAACRWLLYISGVALIGIAGARLALARVSSGPLAALRSLLDHRLARSSTWLTVAWLGALKALLAATIVTWFGVDGLTDVEKIDAMLFQTRWGQSWLITFGAGVLALIAVIAARFAPAARPLSAVVAAGAVIVPTPLLGHASGHGPLLWTLHAAHLGGAGLWFGTVLALVWHTWPIWRDSTPAPGALAQLLRHITPVALTGAALAGSSGLWLWLYHIWPPPATFETPYGTTLAIKMAMVAVLIGFGWLNWRRFGPGAESSAGLRAKLRQSAIAELSLAFVILLGITAWLTGLATPI